MEALAFYAVLAGLCTIDIIAMVKQGFKKEIFPYLVLTVTAGAVGLFLFRPGGFSSLAHTLNSLMGVVE